MFVLTASRTIVSFGDNVTQYTLFVSLVYQVKIYLKPTLILKQNKFPALRPSKSAFEKRLLRRIHLTQLEKPYSDAISATDLHRTLIVLKEIQIKAGKCTSEMEIALMMVKYFDILF